MEEKAYKIMDDMCETMSDMSGVNIKFPRANKKVLKASVISNVVVGTALVAYGITSAHKWTIGLGVLGLANSVYLSGKSCKK